MNQKCFKNILIPEVMRAKQIQTKFDILQCITIFSKILFQDYRKREHEFHQHWITYAKWVQEQIQRKNYNLYQGRFTTSFTREELIANFSGFSITNVKMYFLGGQLGTCVYFQAFIATRILTFRRKSPQIFCRRL